MKINIEEANKYLKKWQNNLRLRDWDIKLHLVDSEWRKSGDIKIDSSNGTAILMLNNFNKTRINLEGLIIHELLHLKLWGMDQMIEELLISTFGQDENDPKFNFAYNRFMQLLESTTEDLTKGYLAVGAENKESTFEYIQKQVEEEIRK